MADNKPTFHHLNNSQSQRIFWLLEELGIEYNLVLHKRNPPNDPKAPFRSPPSLLETGPYGKAPLLITGAKDGNRYVPETSAIATYLIRTFDTEDKFGLKNGDWVRDEMLVSYCNSNMGRVSTTMLMIEFGALKCADNPLGKNMYGPEMRGQFKELERELVEGPKGGFFLGEHPGRADIMLEWPLAMATQRGRVDLKNEFPKLWEWLQRVYARPAFKRSLEKGNGYDLSTFPKVANL